MELTREEFCLFSLKSKIELVEKDGYFLTWRVSGDQFLISLYSIYSFFVEVTYEIPAVATRSVDPVINVEIVDLYDLKGQQQPQAFIEGFLGY